MINKDNTDYFADLQSDLNSAPVGKPKGEEYKETCLQCMGSGLYRGPSRYGSSCFLCKGKGYRIFKSKPEVRAKNKAKSAAKKKAEAERKAAELASKIMTFYKSNEELVDFIDNNRGWSSFYASLWNGLNQFGSLTDGQIQSVKKAMEKSKQPKVADTNISGEGFTKLLAGFNAARESGLKWPKLRIDNIEFTAAGQNSKNPGCLYVKRSSIYIGKITKEGEYFKGRDATADDVSLIERIGRDPFAEAVAYGRRTGNCACCGRELTNAESVALGIGPICAGRFGW